MPFSPTHKKWYVFGMAKMAQAACVEHLVVLETSYKSIDLAQVVVQSALFAAWSKCLIDKPHAPSILLCQK